MSYLLVNDVHIGVNRQAGTTPLSQSGIRKYLLDSFHQLLMAHIDKDVIVIGDLFDTFEVDLNDLVECFYVVKRWLDASKTKRFIFVAGNHDIGKRNDRVSSFSALSSMIHTMYRDRVLIIDKELTSLGNVHVIPHCMNQDLFNLELTKALEVPKGVLLLHANVDNGFAEESDHSLNVDAEMLTRLSKRHIVLFAHEHQARVVSGYKQLVRVLGNQWPSSIADCLTHGEAQKDGCKWAHVLRDDLSLEPVKTWERNGDFAQYDWQELQFAESERFIRIVGSATAEQASTVIDTIARFRKMSSAFVISNAVQIEGIANMDDLSEMTFENVKAFDVLSALLEHLSPEEGEVVKELLNHE